MFFYLLNLFLNFTIFSDGAIILWKLNENKAGSQMDFSDDFGEDIVNKETWNVFKMLRCS